MILAVNGQKLYNPNGTSQEAVQGGVGFPKIKFVFSDDWADISIKECTLSREDIDTPFAVELDENNEVTIPHELLENVGVIELGIYGIVDTIHIKPTNVVPVRVLKGAKSEGQAPSDPTEDQVALIITISNEAKAIAQSVRDDADNGVFNGSDGTNGINGNTLNFMGTWNSNTEYKSVNDNGIIQDMVEYENRLFICLVTNTNIAPPSDNISSQYWRFMLAGIEGKEGKAGKDFKIRTTYSSVAAMNASNGSGLDIGDFVMISVTGNNPENDPDNSKMYIWTEDGFNYVNDMSGAIGITGPAGKDGISIRFRGEWRSFDHYYNNDVYRDVVLYNRTLYTPYDGFDDLVNNEPSDTSNLWQIFVPPGATGERGADGDIPEFQISEGYIQWKLITQNDLEWKNLVALATLKGADASQVQFQATSTHLQWKLVTSSQWTDLVPLSSITGPQGAQGIFINQNGGGEVKLWVGTQAQYLALSPNYDSNTIYHTT